MVKGIALVQPGHPICLLISSSFSSHDSCVLLIVRLRSIAFPIQRLAYIFTRDMGTRTL